MPCTPHFYWVFGFSVIILYGHSHASILIANGVDIATVSKRLGHTKISITIDTYTHALKSRDTAAANLLDDLITSRKVNDPIEPK